MRYYWITIWSTNEDIYDSLGIYHVKITWEYKPVKIIEFSELLLSNRKEQPHRVGTEHTYNDQDSKNFLFTMPEAARVAVKKAFSLYGLA
jgi:hypothetical protein